jgi:hypothetical protein
MKSIHHIFRALYFLSFFLPFLLLPQCDSGGKEVFATESVVHDSIALADSTRLTVEEGDHGISLESSNQDHQNDLPDKTEPGDPAGMEAENPGFLMQLHELMVFPTKNSLSGYGLAFILVTDFTPDWGGITGLLFAFGLLLSLANVILGFFPIKRIIQIAIPATCFVTFTIFIARILIIEQFPLEATLWGLWTCFLLNLIILLLSIFQKKKPITIPGG